MKKFIFRQEQMISTSKRHAEHPFAGQNTQRKLISLQLAQNKSFECKSTVGIFYLGKPLSVVVRLIKEPEHGLRLTQPHFEEITFLSAR